MFASTSLIAYAYLIIINASVVLSTSADLHIVNKVIAPDGFKRSAVLAGSTAANAGITGPLITGRKGDKFHLNVVNSLTDRTMMRSTSIHWHGFFQSGSNWADGPAGVSQCPILPGDSFLYEFRAPGQAGTFWYHSHLATQYCDGLRGPFVVYDPDDPHLHLYDIDNESTIITLADWYHYPSPSAPAIAIPNSTLINGRGRYMHGPPAPLSIVNVVKHKRYRFRLISMACHPFYTFSIDKHNMTIIEVDGINVAPLTVDSIPIFPGQRYSFVLRASQHTGNYWIRSLPHLGNVTSSFLGGVNSAILRYAGASDHDPKTKSKLSNPMLETELHPLADPGAPGKHRPGGADIAINLNISLDRTTHRFSINGAQFVPPNTPILLQIMSGARAAQDMMPAGSVYSLPPNKVIEVSIPGGSPGSPHPFHLHGHTFDVIRSAGSTRYNYDNPVRRDVVSTGEAGDNVTFRFITDNAGPWLLHCHIDWHFDEGLAIVFAEDTKGVASQKTPDAWKDLCPVYDASRESTSGGGGL